MNRIIIARPRNIEAMMAHAAIPFVDGKKSHEQDGYRLGNEHWPKLQFLLLGYTLGKHVSPVYKGVHLLNKPIFV
jgi:hypothetical protein